MSLKLRIVSRQRCELGHKAEKTFGHDGGTIGRSLETDWPLPDRSLYLSSRHASIDFRSGSYYIVDTSKNGVFVNDAVEPVGHGNPQRLFSGDRIRIGDYEIAVAIDNVDDAGDWLLDSDHVDPVDLKQRVESPEPTSYDLIDAHVITGVGMQMFLEDEDSGEIEAVEHQPDRTTPVKPAPAQPTRRPLALDAFFRGVGMKAPKLDARQSEVLLTRLGQITRELVAGLIDGLHLRALQTAQLGNFDSSSRVPGGQGLEVSANAEEALVRLILGGPAQKTNPVASVRAAVTDLQTHQRALLHAMRRAVDEYLDRLDPEQIQRQAKNGRTGALITATNRLRYWDLYKDIYSILASRQPDELPAPFVEALAEAYRQELADAAARTSADARQEAG